MAESDLEQDGRVAPVLVIGEARIAADFLCRAEDWLRDVDPELACRAAGLLHITRQVIERLEAGVPSTSDRV